MSYKYTQNMKKNILFQILVFGIYGRVEGGVDAGFKRRFNTGETNK